MAEKARLRLVPVAELPNTVRRGVYTTLVEEFAASDMKYAKVDGAKASAVISIKKAIASLGLTQVSAVTINGELYLRKA